MSRRRDCTPLKIYSKISSNYRNNIKELREFCVSLRLLLANATTHKLFPNRFAKLGSTSMSHFYWFPVG